MGRFGAHLPIRAVCKNPKTLARLNALGVFPKVKGTFEFPGDGTAGDVLKHIDTHLCPTFADAASFERYKKARRTLGAQDETVPDAILELLIGEFGRNVSQAIILDRLGGKKAVKQHSLRIAELAGSARRPAGRLRIGTKDELFAIVPAGLRSDLDRALAEKTLPQIPAPNQHHIGQICALTNALVRILACLALLSSCIHRRSHAHRHLIVGTAKRLDLILGEDATDQHSREKRWQGYFAKEILPTDRDTVRAQMPDRTYWLWQRAMELEGKLGCKFAEDYPDLLIRLDPAGRRVRVRGPVEIADAGGTQTAQGANTSQSASQDRERRIRLLELAPVVISVVRARILEIEEVLSAFEAAAEGRESCGSFVARLTEHNEDGSPVGRQREVPFHFIDSHELYERYTNFADPISRKKKPSGPEPKMYLALPLDANINDVWFAELLRTRALARLPTDNDDLTSRRRDVLKKLCLAQGRRPRDLLDFKDVDRFLARKAPHFGLALISIIEFYHAMLMAALVIVNALRFGARIGETMQIHLGRDCLDVEMREGRKVPILRLVPKGHHKTAIFDTDDEVRSLIQRIVRLSHARWFSGHSKDGKIDLPVVPYGNRARMNIPPAPYILTNERYALNSGDLGAFVKILLFDVVDMKSHDGRYVMSTIMSLLGYEIDETGHVLHHAPGSRSAGVYDYSKFLSADDIASILKRLGDAGIQGRMG